jgi:hypothetical protein
MELPPGDADKIERPGSDAFSQTAEGVGTALIQAMQDDPQLASF